LASTAAAANTVFDCYQCRRQMDPKKARSHVGEHILKKLRGVEEPSLKQQIGDMFPCGFCGRSGHPGCADVFLVKGKTMQAETMCPHFQKFQYGPTSHSTESTPSTNIPILCTIPGCTGRIGSKYTAVWKYNMSEHIRQAHPGFSIGGYLDGAPLPDNLVCSMYITDEEETRLKIPAQHIP
ncbi:hypothetical protein BV25DRAFT_1764193, partial [Artomyces pyxidatus]